MEDNKLAKVEIYTGMLCGYCFRAKALFQKKNTPFEEIDVSMNPSARAQMLERAGGKTSVPQIFINGTHIGGSDDLYELEFDGELDSLLAT